MKYGTFWWGVQLLAETEEDEKLLKDLFKSLGKGKPAISYEHGEVRFASIEEAKEDDWPVEFLKNAKSILEFSR
jgi:hypothetical protein